MDLRDQFAMAAVQGLLAGDVDAHEDMSQMYWSKGELLADAVARDAYKVADAMLNVKQAQKKPIPVPAPPSIER